MEPTTPGGRPSFSLRWVYSDRMYPVMKSLFKLGLIMFYFFLCDRLVWLNYSSSYDVLYYYMLVYTSKRFLSHFPVQFKLRQICTKSSSLYKWISTVAWFCLRAYVNFAYVNRIEAMCERSCGNVKVAFSFETLYNASMLFTRVKFTWVLVKNSRQWKYIPYTLYGVKVCH